MKVGIIGLGYVGLPLAVAFCEAGHQVVGVDSDSRMVEALAQSRSHIEDVPDERLEGIVDGFHPSTRYADLSEAEKESDREQVRRYLPLIAAAFAERGGCA